MIRLYAFLGNVGEQYALTRHNVAWQFLESLSVSRELSWTHNFKGVYATYVHGGEKRYFLKPETLMNASGESIQALAHFARIEPSEILVIHDELEIPFGFISMKEGGGLGGHNGLRSSVACLGTNNFYRFRIGIGRPNHPNIADYVLSNFSVSERKSLKELVFPQAERAFMACLESGFSAVAEEYKKKNVLED
jgi:peptidyl-tRNA hydrolase, PTH1 family